MKYIIQLKLEILGKSQTASKRIKENVIGEISQYIKIQLKGELDHAFAAGCARSNSRRIAFPSLVTTIPVKNKLNLPLYSNMKNIKENISNDALLFFNTTRQPTPTPNLLFFYPLFLLIL